MQTNMCNHKEPGESEILPALYGMFCENYIQMVEKRV